MKKQSAIASMNFAPVPAAAPEPEPAATAQQAVKLIGTNFRMTPSGWDRLKDLSKAERKSLQLLLEEGLTEVFKKRGLPAFEGVPRAKK